MLKSCIFEPEDAKIIPKVAAEHPEKPVVNVPAGGEDFKPVYGVIGKSLIPLYNLPEKGVQALKALRHYGKVLNAATWVNYIWKCAHFAYRNWWKIAWRADEILRGFRGTDYPFLYANSP